MSACSALVPASARAALPNMSIFPTAATWPRSRRRTQISAHCSASCRTVHAPPRLPCLQEEGATRPHHAQPHMHTARASAARLNQRWAHQAACTARAGSDAAAHAASPRPVPPPTRHPHAAPPPNTHEHAHDHQAARHAQPPVAHPIHPPKARAAAVVSSRKGVGIGPGQG